MDPSEATGDLYDEKVFFVARVDFTPDGNPFSDEFVTVWTNPDLGTTAPTDASAQVNDFLVWDFDFSSISFGGNANTFFDEIREGLSYGDVAQIAPPTGGADFDDDGDVDGDDFLKWQRDLGGATDLANWQTEYGAITPSLSAVPEPGTALLISIAAVGLSLRRRYLFRRC